MMIGQVDGLVDYSSADDSASETSSEKTLQIWEVKDTKTWIFNEMKKLRKHKNYSEIVNYRDDGDAKWHKRLDSIIDAMNKNNIRCGDLYNKGENISKWIQNSSPNPSPKRTYKQTEMTGEFLEWGIITEEETATTQEPYQPTGDDNSPDLGSERCYNRHPPTIPLTCEMEPDMMLSREVPKPPPRKQDEPTPKRFRTSTDGTQLMDKSSPEISIVQKDM